MTPPHPPRTPPHPPTTSDAYGFLPPPTSPDAGAARPAPARRERVAAALFHLGGAVLVGVAGVIAVGALAVISFGTSTCSGDPRDPDLVNDLRLGVVVVGLGFAAVPGLWALIARASHRAWWPWATISALGAGSAALLAAGTTEVAYWCF